MDFWARALTNVQFHRKKVARRTFRLFPIELILVAMMKLRVSLTWRQRKSLTASYAIGKWLFTTMTSSSLEVEWRACVTAAAACETVALAAVNARSSGIIGITPND